MAPSKPGIKKFSQLPPLDGKNTEPLLFTRGEKTKVHKISIIRETRGTF